MYVVRYIKSKKLVHINPAPLEEKLEGQQVYEKFNPTTMEILFSELLTLPQHYSVDKDNIIRELSLEEQVKNGFLKLKPEEKIVNGQIILKTIAERVKSGILKLDEPFEYLSEEKQMVFSRSIKELINNDLLTTPEQCERTQEMIREEVKKEIEKITDPSLELKLLKDFVEWMDEGKPEGDSREKAYRTLQKRIRDVKDTYQKYRNSIDETLKSLLTT